MFTIILILCSLLSLGTHTARLVDQGSGQSVQGDDVQQGTGTGH